ncbi:c-type cytochrome [Sphingomonas sp.]|uniref:c-type cytochrome n=1 Tax=Sphingomonas sp. TaxID=28214 RepID=UPI0038A5F801
MRIAPFAIAACLAITSGCGGPETSQANNAQANISNDSRDVNQAASNLEARLSLGNATKVMHERHEGMETIGKNFKALHRELGGPSPDLGVVRASATTINQLASKASGWFPEGTGPEVGKTGAKPEIWQPQNKADFALKLRNFQDAAQRFSAAAAGNDPNAAKARFADLGGACKACHDKYRSEMHH